MQREVAIQASGAEIVADICQRLRGAGFEVVESFALRSALTLSRSCACSLHRSRLCSCLYSVILVYGAGAAPVALVVHGRDQRYWVRVGAPGAESWDEEWVRQLLQLLSP